MPFMSSNDSELPVAIGDSIVNLKTDLFINYNDY